MKVNLEQLEEMKKELFKQQCDLDIQKAMVKHFIKKKKAEQLTLTDVVKSF
jgi:phosphopantothenoylcysteine synthetase/decarboxylase